VSHELKVFSREDWDARKPEAAYDLDTPVSRLWVHHTGGSMPADYHEGKPHSRGTRADEQRAMREIQDFHMDGRGWSDIAYCYVIFPSGNVYRGRGLHVGAHTEGDNSSSVGVCFYGNFDVERPTDEAREAFVKLANRLQGRRDALTQPVQIDGHFHAPGAATACPGTHLKKHLDDFQRKVNSGR
jgi:hypothetical protein